MQQLLYWIGGTVISAQGTSMFTLLIPAADETAAVTGCMKALKPDWSIIEIDEIRIINEDRSYEAGDILREAMEVAREQGVFLLLCDKSH